MELNKFTFSKLHKEERILVSWLSVQCLPSTIQLLLLFKQLFHFESNVISRGKKLLKWPEGYSSVNADSCRRVLLNLSSPSPALSYDSQHYSCYSNHVFLPRGLIPLGYSSLSSSSFLFLNHSFLPTTYKIRALSNHFNNLAVIQNMKIQTSSP